ncbi:MAG: acyltransferase, partial [Colwellia sp.]|nr:acyltransferase [Colwellia sp.]
ALVVVLAHMIHFDIATGDWIKWLPYNGRDAVILFFLLSGYVISYTTEKKQSGIKDYIVSRATRIYSVAIPVIALTVSLDLIGLQFNPENYTGLYQYEKLYIYIPFHLSFLGEIWTISEQPFTVPPYWSLGYEVWYYVLFAALYFYSGIKRVVIFSLIFVFVGYKLWLLFPLWLAGVWLYKNHDKWQLAPWLANVIFVGSLLGYVLFKQFGIDHYLIALGRHIWPFDLFSLGSAHNYLSDYAVCIFVILHLYAAKYVDLSWLVKYKKPIVTLASYTFTLYLVHAPIILTIEHNMTLNTDSIYTTLGILLVVALVTWGLGFLTEQRKHKFKPAVLYFVNLLIKFVKMIPILKFGLMPTRLGKDASKSSI